MKYRVKVLAILLTLALCIGMFAGCGAKQETAETTAANDTAPATTEETKEETKDPDKKLKVGATIYFMTEFCVLMVDGMKAEAERQNVELTVLDAKNDAALQLSQVENLISMGMDSIIISPVNSDTAEPALTMCEDAGIPCSAVNMTITTDRDYYYCGPNEVQAGELGAKWLLNNVGKECKICIIQGPIGCSAQIYRDEGLFNILDDEPGVEILAIKPGDWNRATAVSLTENWIQTYGDEIDAIISHDDDMGLGVVLALEAAGLKDKIKVIALADAIEEACVSVAAGGLDVTYFQDAFYEGEKSVEMAAQLARGEQPPEMQLLIDMIETEADYAQDLLDNYYGPRKQAG